MFGRFGGNFFGPDIGGAMGTFKQTYRCYSVTMLDNREDVERGGKIIMPPSALDQLTRLHIQYPMLFKLRNNQQARHTHCGVLEFVADEGRIYIPYWNPYGTLIEYPNTDRDRPLCPDRELYFIEATNMMRNLLLEEGDLVEVENVSLQVATFTKFQPQSVDFLDITNPKAVLENMLRNFACLTRGDVISIKYNEREYELCVLETKPDDAISIIECDMNVDFAPPVGYQEPKRPEKKDEDVEMDTHIDPSELVDQSFKAFSGSGNRLDGKKKGLEVTPDEMPSVQLKRGIPNYNHKKGTITFIRSRRIVSDNNEGKEDKDFEAFSGEGQMLRKKGRK